MTHERDEPDKFSFIEGERETTPQGREDSKATKLHKFLGIRSISRETEIDMSCFLVMNSDFQVSGSSREHQGKGGTKIQS